MLRILTLLFAVALVVSCGLKLTKKGISSIEDVLEHRNIWDTSVPQCTDIQLVFDINATVQESKGLNKRYLDCPYPEPGVPCFYYKDPVNPIFSVRNGSRELERFNGSHTFKIVGGGPSRNNIRYYNEREMLEINSFSYSASTPESTVWTVQNQQQSMDLTEEGFVIMRGSENWVGFVCQKNSPCGDLKPQGLLSPDFFFIAEVSNKGVDSSTDCVLSIRFELHIHGFPLLPGRALFCLGMTMITLFIILCSYVLYNICGPKQDREQNSLSDDEELVEANVWTRLEEIYHVIYSFTQRRLFRNFILSVVFFDTALMIAQAFPDVIARGGWVFSAIESCFLGIYLMEMLLKLLALGHNYFRDPWNIIDFLITVLRVVDFLLPFMLSTSIHPPVKKAARAIRAFRLLKAIRSIGRIQVLLTTLVQSLPSIASTSFLMAMVLIMFTVFLRVLYADTVPVSFGTFARTISTLFQVLTLDDWAMVYENSYSKGAPHVMIFLVVFIVIENLILLNFILAVLVDNIGITIENANRRAKAMQDEEKERIRKIEDELSETRPEEESHQEALLKRFSEEKHGERKAELMAEYLGVLASMEKSQFSFHSEAFLLNRLVEISHKKCTKE
uniref:Cation channel sperm-associated protein 1-like n=1 Tax=Astyanax mexicanus TaxID=7994 RepID=W5KQJ1_ASTMX